LTGGNHCPQKISNSFNPEDAFCKVTGGKIGLLCGARIWLKKPNRVQMIDRQGAAMLALRRQKWNYPNCFKGWCFSPCVISGACPEIVYSDFTLSF
jgi:hypothetical protein